MTMIFLKGISILCIPEHIQVIKILRYTGITFRCEVGVIFYTGGVSTRQALSERLNGTL